MKARPKTIELYAGMRLTEADLAIRINQRLRSLARGYPMPMFGALDLLAGDLRQLLREIDAGRKVWGDPMRTRTGQTLTSSTPAAVANVEEAMVLVEQAQVLPAQHGTSVTPGAKNPIGFVDIDATYGVVFSCPHGRFAVQGSDERHKNLWVKFPKGQAVTIHYRTSTEGRLDFLDAEASR